MKNRYLYRYISFEKFDDLVQTKSLHFVRPEVWEDKHEGYNFPKIKNHKWAK
ncbi:hypothetical protein LEP1GSC061_0088 [Leptospira wolffii serovar Khorat str. Khorat-H2]|nr:hypothetical protein LEP1GSC061_0088 [Leptospira wolffii serovar Khorat str. Khorat-H2]